MSRFNSPSMGSKTVNLAGGEAFSQSAEMELASILLTSFANDQFYRGANDTTNRLKTLLSIVDPLFSAKAAIYARNVYGMRTITHVVAAELSRSLSSKPWGSKFYDKIIKRPDDITEIIAYYTNMLAESQITPKKHKKKTITNAMKKGFSLALGRFDKYSLAKYKGGGKEVKMIDGINQIHPKPTEKNTEALSALVKNELKSFDTWEVELSKAGQVGTTEDEVLQLKEDAWKGLISSGKLKYFALLRNLRNIIQQAPDALPEAIKMLVDAEQIKKSLVFPFRFLSAYKEIVKMPVSTETKKAIQALNQAIDLSLSNVPKFEGETLVVLDVSSSMNSAKVSGKSEMTVAEIGGIFATVLAKANNADLMLFHGLAWYVHINPLDSTMTIATSIRFNGGSTNFQAVFDQANKKYDRIILLSDMQGWVGWDSPAANYEAYKRRTGAKPIVYSFDLAGYGTMQLPEPNVYMLAGFSDKTMDLMKYLELDKKALINEINKIEL